MFQESSQDNQSGAAVAEYRQRNQSPREQKKRSAEPTEPSYSAPEENGWQKMKGFRLEFGPSRRDILNFTNQLAVMIRAGISLQDSLESSGEPNTNHKFKAIIIDLQNRIDAGQS